MKVYRKNIVSNNDNRNNINFPQMVALITTALVCVFIWVKIMFL